MDNTKTGAFIRELRKEKNMTQKELADRFCILTAEHFAFPDFTARFPVKRKRDGIKNRCFSSAGVPRNQIQTAAQPAPVPRLSALSSSIFSSLTVR